MSRYTDFFLNSRADAVQLDLLEITHPAFTQPYRIVRNARAGVIVDLSPGEQDVEFSYYPARVKHLGASDDLEAMIQVELGDLGEVLPLEIDAVEAAGAFLIRPVVRYWAYRSDDLSAPIFGPIVLEMPKLAHNREGAAFEARAPSLDVNRTGETYRLERFPMMRGFL
jgi:hypothetical protein